jgi:hypothetical protein
LKEKEALKMCQQSNKMEKEEESEPETLLVNKKAKVDTAKHHLAKEYGFTTVDELKEFLAQSKYIIILHLYILMGIREKNGSSEQETATRT